MSEKKVISKEDKKLNNFICIALDVPTISEAKEWVDRLHSDAGYFKIGLELYLRSGNELISYIKSKGCNVFLDLKFHDIPNTVYGACKAAASQSVDIVNVHASGGTEMIKKAKSGLKDGADEAGLKSVPMLACVTLLTSISKEILNNELNINLSCEEFVKRLTIMSINSGADSVVCSANDVQIIRKLFDKSRVFIITPGIRPDWAATDDQSRIATPGTAVKNGSDLLVIGRPIRKHKDPVSALKKVKLEIKANLPDK